MPLSGVNQQVAREREKNISRARRKAKIQNYSMSDVDEELIHYIPVIILAEGKPIEQSNVIGHSDLKHAPTSIL